MLSEKGELILKNKEIANTFNDHRGSLVDNPSLDHWDCHSLSPTLGSDRIYNIVPADTDVFKTSLGRLKKVTTS